MEVESAETNGNVATEEKCAAEPTVTAEKPDVAGKETSNGHSTAEKENGTNEEATEEPEKAAPAAPPKESKKKPVKEKKEPKPKAAPSPKKEKAPSKKEARPLPADDGAEDQEMEDGLAKTPELEAPLIVEGKRQRKKVERLATEMFSPQQQSKELGVPHGSGTKLGEIKYIEHVLSKTDVDDLKPMHRLCYGRSGTAHEIRRNLRQFCGFEFDKSAKDYEHKKRQLEGWSAKHLKKTCEVLGLERSGQKEKLTEEILGFLLAPKDTGKKLPKSAGGTGKKKASRKRAPAKKTKKAKTEESSGSESGTEKDEDEDSEEEKDETDEKDEEEEDEQPKKKKAKKETKAPKASPKKPTKATKSGESGTPSNAEIQKVVKDILKTADLDKVTMKEVVSKVSARFPEKNLAPKKDFIKNTVKAMISAAD